MSNVHKDEDKAILTWKKGPKYPKSAVLADYQLFETEEINGTPGWVSPEQCLGQCMNRLGIDCRLYRIDYILYRIEQKIKLIIRCVFKE